jgi:hypothetical protein
LRIAAHLAAAVEATPRPLEPALFAAADAYARPKPFREAYRDVAAEIAAGTFAPAASPPPGWDPDALTARLAARPAPVPRWPAWRALFGA